MLLFLKISLPSSFRLAAAAAWLTLSASAYGGSADTLGDLKLAPPPFGPSNSYVPIDISTVYVNYEFGSGKAAEATVTFKQGQDGKPFFDLVPEALELSVDGETLDPKLFKTVKTPNGKATVRVIDKTLKAGVEHVAKIKYRMHGAKISGSRANVGFFMADNSGRGFYEKYGPANLQFDAIQFIFEVKVTGGEPHVIFENGKQESLGPNHWKVTYPPTYNSASLYFHLLPKSVAKVKTATFKGIDKEIPVTVYTKDQDLGKFMDKTLKKLAELEGHFGASPHPKYVIYAVKAGGMEHAGACISNDYALHHELTHSWFARSVMPADGNSAWIDEGIAMWQDNKYSAMPWPPRTKPANIGKISPYYRATPSRANYEGRMFIAGLHTKFKDKGGMFAALKKLHSQYEMKRITNAMFLSFINEFSGEDLTSMYNKYIYNNSERLHSDRLPESWAEPIKERFSRSKHPRPYTDAELYELQ